MLVINLRKSRKRKTIWKLGSIQGLCQSSQSNHRKPYGRIVVAKLQYFLRPKPGIERAANLLRSLVAKSLEISPLLWISWNRDRRRIRHYRHRTGMYSNGRDALRGIFSHLWRVTSTLPTKILTPHTPWFRLIAFNTTLSVSD